VALIIETSMVPGRGMLRGIAQYVREHGPWSMYSEPRGLDRAPPAWLRRWRGDGIIARLSSRQLTAAVVNAGVPAIDLLGVAPAPSIPIVHSDDWAIGRLAAAHLLERGFRHFAFCGVRAIWSERPCEAFCEAVRAAGHDCQLYELPFHHRTHRSLDTDQRRLARWIRSLPKPVGLMACSDPRAQHVLEACRQAEVVVPDDVSVIGVGNDETICEFCDVPLSTVAPNHRLAGYEAARLLDRLMRGEPPPREPLYLPPLGVVTRQSTDVVAVDDPETKAAVRFIREHASQGIGVQDVADHCLLSRTELKRRFRRFLSRSIHDQIIGERIKRAQQLLADTDLPIAQVARAAGFRRQEYLGVVFKSRLGKTPGEFRRQI
jgi:LacI family transcriptional regulator